MNKDLDVKIKKYKELEIKYIIDKAKRKNIYLTIKNDIVYVKITNRMSKKDALLLLEKNIEWVYKKYKESVEKYNNKKDLKIKNGSKVILVGKKYTVCIKYVDKQIEKSRKRIVVKIENDLLVFYIRNNIKIYDNNDSSMGSILEKALKDFKKEELEKYILEYKNELEKKMQLKANEYRIRELKSAWGTCSTTKNISINLDLIKYNNEIIRHVLIHEMAHLKYMNHSKDFWSLVEKYDNNYKENGRKLKKGLYE